METSIETERRGFVRAYATGVWTMTELCARFGITRPTGYTWVARWRAEGEPGCVDRSCAPHTSPHRTDTTRIDQIVAARHEYGWGATKLLAVLRRRHPECAWPARSTVNALLEQRGLLRKQRRTRRWPHPGAAPLVTTAPNQVWPADFKGQFKTRDGVYCYPLTVTDHFSRAVLLCRALPSTKAADARPAFRALFEAVGLPDAIRTDNGAPFASLGLHGLTALTLWWMQLGIHHQRNRPGYPQGNGTHERMHRELKRETARPPAATTRAQQRRFQRFQRRYNEERPHEALADRTPAMLWQPSTRPYPRRPVPPEYPSHWEVRRVKPGGEFTYHGRRVFLSQVLRAADVGLEPIGDGLWNVVYYHTVLARWDERTGTVTPG
jgi:transposase InsO family protein